MGNKGMRQYVCQDCGALRMFMDFELFRQSGRAHCIDCGGTFWEPKSQQAKKDRKALQKRHHQVSDHVVRARFRKR